MLREHPDFNLSKEECISRVLQLELPPYQAQELERSGWNPEECLFKIAYRHEPDLGRLMPFCQLYAPTHGFSEPGLGIVFYDKKLRS